MKRKIKVAGKAFMFVPCIAFIFGFTVLAGERDLLYAQPASQGSLTVTVEKGKH